MKEINKKANLWKEQETTRMWVGGEACKHWRINKTFQHQ
jgi:hypothetical protein